MTDQIPLATPSSSAKPKFKNQLAYKMALALLLFAVLPILIMGLAGYFQALSLLKEQTATQIHRVAHSQANTFDRSMHTKEIRLDRISHRFSFLEAAEHITEADSVFYQEQLLEEFDAVNRPDGQPLFDGFFLVGSDGIVYAGSDNTWNGASLTETLLAEELNAGKGSTGLYDLNPFF